jgi:hypothetical protein
MLRIIQWATGTVGKHAIRAVHDDPELELVGALVYSDDKAGRDAGEIAGLGPIGVTATTDVDAVLDLDADCVFYAAQGEGNPMRGVEDVCRILASGKNVVSTAVTALIYPRSMGDEVVDRIEAACREGGTSFHGTGIEPGWAAEVLPLTMSALFRRIESVHVMELLDYSSYPSAAMLFDGMGFGRPPVSMDDVPKDAVIAGMAAFRAPLMLLADALDATITDWDFTRDAVVADEDFEITAGPIAAGTMSALRYSLSAVIDGRAALTVEHVTRLRPDQAPEWPTGRGWHVTIEGVPSMQLKTEIGIHGEDENDQSCLGTAMHAVHAFAPVCAAAPGIRTFLDLPIIAGRGALRRG